MQKVTDNNVVGTQIFQVSSDDGVSWSTNGAVLNAWKTLDYLATSGEVTPNFHHLRRTGQVLPFTNFQQVHYRGSSTLKDFCWYHQSNPQLLTRWIGTLAAGLTISPNVWSEGSSLVSGHWDPDRLSQMAAARANSSGWDALSFVGELPETARMFRKALQRASDIATYRKGDPAFWKRSFRENFRDLPDHYMEGRYGWRPLLYDIQDVKQAADSERRENRIQVVRAGLSDSWDTISQPSAYYNEYRVTDVRKRHYELNGRGTVAFKGARPRFQLNPIKTAWELTRLSFVLDWFVNVGNVIDAASFVLFHPEYKAGVGYELFVTDTYETKLDLNPGWSWKTGTPVLKSQQTMSFVQRWPANISLYPQPYVNLNTLKYVDLAALTVQNLLKRR